MTIPSKSSALEARADDLPRTIPEFCRRNRISITTYFKLRQLGKGPREMRALSKVLITAEAERDWRRDRETPDKRDTATIERLHARGRKAGRRSAVKRGGRK